MIVATPTDLDQETNRLDTFSVESVTRTIRELNKRCLIVIKSTIGIGLTDKLINQYGGNIIFVPEFLREKSALKDAFYPSRIIFGIKKMSAKISKFQFLVESCVRNDEKVMFMKSSNAEAVKLFSNTYLSMRIAFFNELDTFGYQNTKETNETGPIKSPKKNKLSISVNEQSIITKPRVLGVYEFNKMSSNRNIPSFPYVTDKGIPSIGYYCPKFDCISKKMYDVYLVKKEDDETTKKKKLLHKIIHRYDINADYKSVKGLNRRSYYY